MYTKVVLTLILLAMIAVAVGMWRPEYRDPPPMPQEPSAGELLLHQRIRDFDDLRGITREEAVKRIGDSLHVNLVVDWGAFSSNSADEQAAFRNTKLDGYMGDVSLATAMKVIFGQTVGCQIDGKIVTISHNSVFVPSEMAVHAYDVSDLVSDSWWGVKAPEAQAVSVQAARMERIRDVVTQHTESLGWRINYTGSGGGGGNASLSVCGSCLIATQTPDGQVEIAKVLRELRRAGPR